MRRSLGAHCQGLGMVDGREHLPQTVAAASPSPRRSATGTLRLVALLSVVLISSVATGCEALTDAVGVLYCIVSTVTLGKCGDDPAENKPAVDCLPHGPDLCGPPWDRDNDTISTATETNPTNRIGNSPIAGFYTFDTLRWDLNRSRAVFGPTDGFLDYGMNLRDQGAGYLHYLGADPQVDTDDWGTGHLLRLIEGSGRDWADTLRFKSYPRLMSGDMSVRGGGVFPGHTSHRNGLDVDMRYIRKDGSETDTLNICTQKSLYDTAATISLWNTIGRNGNGTNGRSRVERIFTDTTCVGIVDQPGQDIIRHESGHQNHFHVRIRNPHDTTD